MIGLWVAGGLLTVAVLCVLLRPLVRQRAGANNEDRDSVVAVFRRQLAEIDADLAAGALAAADAIRARAEITRRMLEAADRETRQAPLPPGTPAELPWRIGAAVGIAGLLPAAALAIYLAVGMPNPAERAPAVAGHDAASLATAAAQLSKRLEAEPGDVAGWALLGRTLASLGRFPEARDAFRHAVKLVPGDPDLHAALGEMLVASAQGTVTPEAEAEFKRAPDDPRSRFYGAEAAAQRGDTGAARTALQALLADAPADAQWRQVVAERLAELSPGQAQPAPAAVSGPSPQDMAAAQSMSPEERQAMIRSMVERLAARLEQQPEDKAGWARLARAYEVLGDTDKAQAARARVEGGAGDGAPPSAAAPSPTTQDVAAAQAMPPSDQQAMIRGMVDRLAARLDADPSDAQGWLMLVRSYRVLGRQADALAALQRANAHIDGNAELLKAYLDVLATGTADDQIPPEVVRVATRLNALDGNQPEALWYLGLAASQHGDRAQAAAYWQHLLHELPAGAAERASVQQRLDALR
jgi:cytochrome c-type biogenesis protein CcmH